MSRSRKKYFSECGPLCGALFGRTGRTGTLLNPALAVSMLPQWTYSSRLQYTHGMFRGYQMHGISRLTWSHFALFFSSLKWSICEVSSGSLNLTHLTTTVLCSLFFIMIASFYRPILSCLSEWLVSAAVIPCYSAIAVVVKYREIQNRCSISIDYIYCPWSK